MATRGRPPGSPKTGGRVKGKSLDKGERLLITSQMAGDLLAVYESLGGADWLLKFAKANPKEFIQQLSRLFPAAHRDDGDLMQQNNQFNFNSLSPLEAARRVAFAISAGVNALEDQQLSPAIEAVRVTSSRPAPESVRIGTESVEQPEMSPQEACRWGAPDQPNPSPESEGLDPARQRWVDELPLTAEQRADNALVRETREADISNYRGSAAEQPGGSVPRPAPRQPSAGERRRAVMNRRRNDLL